VKDAIKLIAAVILVVVIGTISYFVDKKIKKNWMREVLQEEKAKEHK
jgi:uncharacterized protein (UPF0333 family)